MTYNRDKAKAWYAANREAILARLAKQRRLNGIPEAVAKSFTMRDVTRIEKHVRALRQQTVECLKSRKREKYRRWRENNRDKCREAHRKGALARQGCTIQEYEHILRAQGTHCALCPVTPDQNKRALALTRVDGTIRGLLCTICSRRVHGLLHRAALPALLNFLR